MKLELKQDNFVVHGYYTLSNYGGLEIQLSDNCEFARLRYYNKLSKWQKIKYNRAGLSYVTYWGKKYLLNVFLKVNI